MKNNKIITKFFTLAIVMFFTLFTTTVSAQDETFPDDVNDETPIDSYVLAGLIAGAALGYTLLRKKQIAKL